MTQPAALPTLTSVPPAAHLEVTTYRHPDLDAGHPAHLRRDPALDGLRGVAVLAVFLFHYGGGLTARSPLLRAVGVATQAGWIGLILFFTLSGFLITGILWDSLHPMPLRHWVRNFYARRALRILPLYYLAIFLCAFVSLANGGRFVEIASLLLSVFFLQGLPGLGVASQQGWIALPLFHLWSVAVEEYFYLLWPLALVLCRTRRRALQLSLVIFMASAIFRFVVWMTPLGGDAVPAHTYDTTLFTHAGALALGAALALVLRSPNAAAAHSFLRRAAPWAFAVGVLLYITVGLLIHDGRLQAPAQYGVGLTGITLACPATIVFALRRGVFRRALASPLLRFFGRISYGFYVYHLLLQPLYDAIGFHFAHNYMSFRYHEVRLAAAFAITVAVSWVSWEYFESPLLALKERFPLRHPVPQDSSA